MTNKEFSEKDQKFIKACEEAGLPFASPPHQKQITKRTKPANKNNYSPSLSRQASKWKNNKGIAYKKMKGIL